MERIPVNWITNIPLITRIWTISSLITSLLIDTNIIQLSDLIFMPSMISTEPWRLCTSFLYMGQFDVNLIVSLYFLVQYTRQLEESFHRTKDYLWFIVVCSTMLLLYSYYVKNLGYLGAYLSEVLNYFWSRKNPRIMMGYMGLIEFQAGYLSLMLILISMINRSSDWDPWVELPPFLIGHCIFYFDEVIEKLYGFNPLSPPWTWSTGE